MFNTQTQTQKAIVIVIRHMAAGIYFAIFNKRYRPIDFWLPFYSVNIRGIIIQFPRPRIHADNSIFSVQRINMVNLDCLCVCMCMCCVSIRGVPSIKHYAKNNHWIIIHVPFIPVLF